MSGPIMDRIDIWLEVDRVLPSDLHGGSEGNRSEAFRVKVEQARQAQKERFNKKGRKILRNSEMSARDMVTLITLDKESRRTLDLAAERAKEHVNDVPICIGTRKPTKTYEAPVDSANNN